RAIRLALGEEAVRGFAIERAPFALEKRALVPVEAEPAHGVEDLVRQVAAAPLDVGVLDAKDERAFVAAREEPVVEGRARPADVKGARRGGRETDAWGRHRAARIAAALSGMMRGSCPHRPPFSCPAPRLSEPTSCSSSSRRSGDRRSS